MTNRVEIQSLRLRLLRAGTAVVTSAVFGLTAAAVPILNAQVVGAGTFNLAGAVDITSTAFTFGADVAPPPGDQMARIELPLTGQFSGITAGMNVQIKNLSAPTVTPGTPFVVSGWITLPDAIDLDLNNIPISRASHVCSAADDAPGSICAMATGSPITLEQGTSGVTMLMNFSGVAYFISSPRITTPWSGNLAVDFSGETVSGLLDTFDSTGHITTGYEANFNTIAVTGPQQLTQSIVASVNALRSQRILKHGEDHSLIVKLQRAINSMNTGHNAVAIRHLNAFIGEVNDLLSDGVLSSSQATPLVSTAEDVIALLS